MTFKGTVHSLIIIHALNLLYTNVNRLDSLQLVIKISQLFVQALHSPTYPIKISFV